MRLQVLPSFTRSGGSLLPGPGLCRTGIGGGGHPGLQEFSGQWEGHGERAWGWG